MNKIRPMPLGTVILRKLGSAQREVKSGQAEGVQLPLEYATWGENNDQQEPKVPYAKDGP